ncbi:kinase-like domain-containing protein, partial [Catenaria anguillulae PL171]
MHTQDWASSPSVSTAAAASASSSGNSAFTPQLPAPNRIADPNEPSYDQYYRTFGDTEADRQAHEFDDGPLDLHNGHAGRGGTGGGSASDHSDSDDDEHHRVVNTDPTGRFQCWDICLGKGAFKEVYKAFDVEEGIEVAWNQLRTDIISRKDITKVASEVRLLKQLRHDNIINFTDVWTARGPDGRERVYFITELMSSGTLKSFIRKAKGKLKLKVVKNLCRHILRGLAYLHSRTPPIIHRDLKCDNIFINGNNGVAKIGDLGLATIKNKDHISSVVGTPEFLAPELYEERYDERVDIYAFGMCVLELVTKEYPYQECANQAQIWKRVSAGIKPQALAKVADPETRQFIELCIAHDYHQRPSAQQLLDHPFL